MKPFPKEKLARMYAIYTILENGGSQSFDYKTLKLKVQNGQLCFHHKQLDIIMPIARKSTILKLFSEHEFEADYIKWKKERNNNEKN